MLVSSVEAHGNYWPRPANRHTAALEGIAFSVASRSATGGLLRQKREWPAPCSKAEDDPKPTCLIKGAPLPR